MIKATREMVKATNNDVKGDVKGIEIFKKGNKICFTGYFSNGKKFGVNVPVEKVREAFKKDKQEWLEHKDEESGLTLDIGMYRGTAYLSFEKIPQGGKLKYNNWIIVRVKELKNEVQKLLEE